MTIKTHNQAGTVDLVLILVVLLAALGIGGYVLHEQAQTKQAQDAAANGVIVAKLPAAQQQSIMHTGAEASSMVQDIYSKYLVNSGGSQAKNLYGRYFTPMLSASIFTPAGTGSGSKILCSQNLPSEVTYEPAQISANTATVRVNTYFGTNTNYVVRVTVELSSLLISQVICPVGR
jgi:uncharacterized protein (UPF0333 family)